MPLSNGRSVWLAPLWMVVLGRLPPPSDRPICFRLRRYRRLWIWPRHICPDQNIYVLAKTYMSWPGHTCPDQDIYVLARTYNLLLFPGQDIYHNMSSARRTCPGQDVYVLARTYKSWPRHVCPSQDIYVLARTYIMSCTPLVRGRKALNACPHGAGTSHHE